MDVRAALLRAAAARPRVLLVTLPGGVSVRVAAERELRRHDLPDALTPALADLLLVAGPDSPELRPAVERLWQDMPAPRSRAHVRTPGEIADAIDTCRSQLADTTAQRTNVAESVAGGDREPSSETMHGDHGGGEEPGSAREAGDGHSGHQGTGEHGGHEGHGGHAGHRGDAMVLPGGLPMAEQDPDRDGLMLDRLHVPLGPLLAEWPAGLLAHLTLQGDVVQEVEVSTEHGEESYGLPFWSEPWLRALGGEEISVGAAARRRAAAHVDSLGRLMAVAGWPAAATSARRLRDDLLAGAAATVIRPTAHRFARRVGQSRTLFWQTRGIGQLSETEARSVGVDGPAAQADGDVPARYRQWLGAVLEDLDRLDDRRPLDPARDEGPRGRLDAGRWPSRGLMDLLPRLLPGAELAAARLIVASLDPDPDELATRYGVMAGG